MPQLIQPYNPWFMGIEAAVAAAVIGGAMSQPPSMGAAVGIAVVIGSWNYYVQKNYPVPRKLIERAEVLKYKQELGKLDRSLGGNVPKSILEPGAKLATENWEHRIESKAALQF